jgi:hypothetical protein
MRKLAIVFAIGICFSGTAFAQTVQQYLGRWDITLRAPDKEYPSWIEVKEADGKLSADFVGRWGNARPLPTVRFQSHVLTFVSPKEEEDAKRNLVFHGEIRGDMVVGTVNGPKGGTWKWTAVRAPELKENPAPKWGQPVELFDGKDLTGWTMSDPKTKNPWKVVDGALVSPSHGPEIINDRKFGDLKLHVEFKADDNSNSGVYLRGRYEVQIETNSAQESNVHHMGAIYGFYAAEPENRTANVWHTYDITLVGRWITVVQDGKTIIDHKEIPGITGGALDSHEAEPGPIYLQGSEDGHVAFRKITITPAE